MIHSMTGYAAGQGDLAPWRWSCELRSVNGKGLDLRLRVPDWIEGLESELRARLGKAVARGNVSLSLRVLRDDAEGTARINSTQLDAVLGAMAEVEARAMDVGVTLAPATGAAILALRGVMEIETEADDTAPLKAALLAAVPGIIAEFNAARAQEGAALADVLSSQLDDIERLTEEAAALLNTRQTQMAENLQRNVDRLLGAGLDADRLAQELALIAVKTDVTEEIDRLRAHVAAARGHLASDEPVGRKMDFLMQEFNREANTLCSKAQMQELTQVGLALKVVIDQMREQVQNVE